MIGNELLDATYCSTCSDTGWEVVVGSGARKCRCPAGQALKLLSQPKVTSAFNVVPKRYEDLRIESMKPMLHPAQKEVLDVLKAKPRSSLIMFGNNSYGTGKSALLWALFSSARDAGREVLGCTLSAFLELMQRWETGGGNPPIQPEHLRLWNDGIVCLDEIEKIKTLSRFAAQQFFNLVNICYEQRIQIVVATNLGKTDIADFWASVDGAETYGPAISRRLFQADHAYHADFGRNK